MRTRFDRVLAAAGLLGVLALGGPSRVEAGPDPTFVGIAPAGPNDRRDNTLALAGGAGAGRPRQGDLPTRDAVPGPTPADASPATTPAMPVPEPGSLALIGVGVVGLMGLRWRRRLQAPA